MSKRCFSLYIENIREVLQADMLGSHYYQELPNKLDLLTTLADRIMIASQNHPELGSVYTFRDAFVKSIKEINDVDKASIFLRDIEKWLKVVLYFAFPDRWEKQSKQEESFSLFPAIRQLELLDQKDLECKEVSELKDVIKQFIWNTKSQRDIETHRTAIQTKFHKNNHLLYALTTMFAPLFKHYHRINENLKELIIRSVDKSIEDLCSTIKSERQDNINTFKGREDEIDTIAKKLTGGLRESGGYFLISGVEGIGKSALCAKVSDRLLYDQKCLIPLEHNIRNISPWLPGQLLHFGKWEKNPLQIVRSLISQANTMLLEPVPLPSKDDTLRGLQTLQSLSHVSTFEEDYDSNYAVSGESFDDFSKTPFKNYSPSPRIMSLPGRVKQAFPFEQTKELNALYNSEYNELEQYKVLLLSTLRQLVEQYGPIVIIIDALDEISHTPEDFSFLPQRLPEGVSALLTVRPNLGIDTWLINQSRLSIYSDNLTSLLREEIPLFTGVDDYKGQEEKKFNDQVFKRSGGWSLHVAAITRKLQEVNGDFSRVNVEVELDKYFQRQRNEWWNSYTDDASKSEYLREILNLLALFEPVSAIDFDDIQGYLEYRFNEYFDTYKLINLLKPVAYQIQGLDTSKKKVKLGIKAFAEDVRKVLGKRTLMRTLNFVSEWLIQDDEVEIKIVADFIIYWINEGSNKHADVAKNIITTLKEGGDLEKIKEITLQAKGNGDRSKAFLYCVKVLAESNDPLYMYLFSALLANGKGIKEDVIEAEKWLRKSAELKHIPAMRALGFSLLEGGKLPINKKEGEKWLRKAIEFGDEETIVILGCRLIDGEGLTQNVEEGYQLLNQASNNNNLPAIIIFSNRLIEGKGIEKDPEKGKELLLKAVNQLDSKRAMHILGGRLLSGRGLSQNLVEGEEWLRKSAERNHLDAIHDLGVRLTIGDQLKKNLDEGLEWLEKGAELGNIRSMIDLADINIKGILVSENTKMGEKWLIEASKAKSKKAMILLGDYYLKGKYNFPYDKDEAEKWFHMAADLGSNIAHHRLGFEYIKGENLQKNLAKGLRHLQVAVDNNHFKSFNSLGMLLVQGDMNVPRKPIEGEKLLRIATEKGYQFAKFNLANLLIEGEYIKQNLEEGLQLLQELVEEKFPSAIKNLSIRLLKGLKISKDSERAKQILLKAIDQGIPEAMYVLGFNLISGEVIEQDLQEGERLLNQACNAGLVKAICDYGDLLLVGDIIKKDEERGINLLNKAFDEGVVEAGYSLGLYYYKEKQMEEAFRYFYSSYKQGFQSSAVSLLYLFRRNEISKTAQFKIDDVLNFIKRNQTTLGNVNYALYLINQSTDVDAWRKADNIFANLTDVEESLDWWNALAKNKDPEGNLVLGWLLRHHKIEDPDGFSIKERFADAVIPYKVPHWILKVVNKNKIQKVIK
ncbi:AAA family ATPase [Peribacillus simplex]|uniref:AAA family ATPase n=1 Tax=Peribacillus simplex TaxID=1478 RepID=UPI0037F49C9B